MAFNKSKIKRLAAHGHRSAHIGDNRIALYLGDNKPSNRAQKRAAESEARRRRDKRNDQDR